MPENKIFLPQLRQGNREPHTGGRNKHKHAPVVLPPLEGYIARIEPNTSGGNKPSLGSNSNALVKSPKPEAEMAATLAHNAASPKQEATLFTRSEQSISDLHSLIKARQAEYPTIAMAELGRVNIKTTQSFDRKKESIATTGGTAFSIKDMGRCSMIFDDFTALDTAIPQIIRLLKDRFIAVSIDNKFARDGYGDLTICFKDKENGAIVEFQMHVTCIHNAKSHANTKELPTELIDAIDRIKDHFEQLKQNSKEEYVQNTADEILKIFAKIAAYKAATTDEARARVGLKLHDFYKIARTEKDASFKVTKEMMHDINNFMNTTYQQIRENFFVQNPGQAAAFKELRNKQNPSHFLTDNKELVATASDFLDKFLATSEDLSGINFTLVTNHKLGEFLDSCPAGDFKTLLQNKLQRRVGYVSGEELKQLFQQDVYQDRAKYNELLNCLVVASSAKSPQAEQNRPSHIPNGTLPITTAMIQRARSATSSINGATNTPPAITTPAGEAADSSVSSRASSCLTNSDSKGSRSISSALSDPMNTIEESLIAPKPIRHGISPASLFATPEDNKNKAGYKKEKLFTSDGTKTDFVVFKRK